MRLAMDPADPGFSHWRALQAEGGRARVYLDGELVHAVMADDVKGEVICFRIVDGEHVLNDDRTEVIRDHRFGKVRIEPFRA